MWRFLGFSRITDPLLFPSKDRPALFWRGIQANITHTVAGSSIDIRISLFPRRETLLHTTLTASGE